MVQVHCILEILTLTLYIADSTISTQDREKPHCHSSNVICTITHTQALRVLVPYGMILPIINLIMLEESDSAVISYLQSLCVS